MKEDFRSYEFVLVLSGATESDALVEDALYEAGCDDAMLSFRAGTAFVDFDRESPSFEQAVLSAIRDVERSGVRLSVVRVEPGDLVTAAEIARRAALTREYIRLLVQGERGPGHFPAPRSGITGKTLVWSWAEVSRWLLECGIVDDDKLVESAIMIRDLNDALELRSDPAARARRLKYLRELRRLGTEHVEGEISQFI